MTSFIWQSTSERPWKKRLGFGNWMILGNGAIPLRYSCDGSNWYQYRQMGVDLDPSQSYDSEIFNGGGLRLYNADLWISFSSEEAFAISSYEIIQLPEDVYLFPDFKEILTKANKF